MNHPPGVRVCLWRRALCALPALLLAISAPARAQVEPAAVPAPPVRVIEHPGPAGSGEFGRTVAVLPSGHIVVADPGFDQGQAQNMGAVYLLDGATLATLSVLKGSAAADAVGSGGITVLQNGNYVVASPQWGGGKGAATWGNQTTGAGDIVSAANSLVGTAAGHAVGSGGVVPLVDSHYVVLSPQWDNGSATDAGAITWGNGGSGSTGAIAPANSLVGSRANDRAGSTMEGAGVVPLPDGSYVVLSPYWANGAATAAGAVTHVEGGAPFGAPISAQNSLVGSNTDDQIGSRGITLLAESGAGDPRYVVKSPLWNQGLTANVGAATWIGGPSETNGPVSASNSLVGSNANDFVGAEVFALRDGHYLVQSSSWNNGAIQLAGAVTWGNGAQGVKGPVSAENSLVGTHDFDQVGFQIALLDNGNYVVCSNLWDGMAADATPLPDIGAVTWGGGASGVRGAVSAQNSLTGAHASDAVCSSGVTPLADGNYLVLSNSWDGEGAPDAGAATWGNGTLGTTGIVTATNSLIGAAGDRVAEGGAIALPGGSFVVFSPYWSSGGALYAGAATWSAAGAGRRIGTVAAANSLVGNVANQQVGRRGVALANGHYLVLSPEWEGAGQTNIGAVTWANGTTGLVGVVGPANSLLGGSDFDQIGSGGGVLLADGGYLLRSPRWKSGALEDVGAVTWGSGSGPLAGQIGAANSFVGSAAGELGVMTVVLSLPNGAYLVADPQMVREGVRGAVTLGDGRTGSSGPITPAIAAIGTGTPQSFQFDPVHQRVVVGTPQRNSITLLALAFPLTVSKSGDGSGRVVSAPAGIDCGPTCTASFNSALRVSLTAVPGAGARFAGWSGACSGAGGCTVTMDRARSVGAHFIPTHYTLSVTKSGPGTVTSSPAGIDCGPTCSASFAASSSVALSAAPAPGATFAGWTGACSGAGACTVVMDQNRTLAARFVAAPTPDAPVALSVSKSGGGGGSVTSSPAGIACGAACRALFAPGSRVSLAASPDANSIFSGWGGACSETECSLVLTQPVSVTAAFALRSRTLAVQIAGDGAGVVRIQPPGLDCADDCRTTAVHGAAVTLAASPQLGSLFAGWGGACSGATGCALTMAEDRTVTATFSLRRFTVRIDPAPQGGSIRVEPLAAATGSAEAADSYPFGARLRLTATAATGFTFAGWTGDRSGAQNPIEITVEGPLTIGADFTAIPTPDDGGTRIYLPAVQR